ncbi:MAG: transcriptional regulator [Gracilibacter sp. BRH_c7a]|nr:MAG: transcriptional regulator [Gracilibacter sp. BRH_c7a]
MEQLVKTKEKIILACEQLAMKDGRGFYNLSMEELAQVAGVSKRTIYRYFGSKEEVIEATVVQTMDKIELKNLELFASGTSIQELITALLKNVTYMVNQQVIEDLSTHYPFIWQKIDKIRQSKVDLLINHLLSQSEIKMRWRVDPKIFKASLLSAMTVVMTPRFVMESGMSLEEVGHDFLNMFLFGALERVHKEN